MRLYSPPPHAGALGCAVCFAPRHSSSLSVRECGAAGFASGQTACPVHPMLHQSRSRHGHASPLRPGCPSPPLLPVWMNVYFLSTWCRTSLPFDFLSVLVVRGGSVCLPTPPSWFSSRHDFRVHLNSTPDLPTSLSPLQLCVWGEGFVELGTFLFINMTNRLSLSRAAQ